MIDECTQKKLTKVATFFIWVYLSGEFLYLGLGSRIIFFSHKNELFYPRKSNKSTISSCFLSSRSRYRSRIYLRIRLPSFFGAALAPVFFKRLRLRFQGAKTCGSSRLRLPRPAYSRYKIVHMSRLSAHYMLSLFQLK